MRISISFAKAPSKLPAENRLKPITAVVFLPSASANAPYIGWLTHCVNSKIVPHQKACVVVASSAVAMDESAAATMIVSTVATGQS